jgi:hypothetical protein
MYITFQKSNIPARDKKDNQVTVTLKRTCTCHACNGPLPASWCSGYGVSTSEPLTIWLSLLTCFWHKYNRYSVTAWLYTVLWAFANQLWDTHFPENLKWEFHCIISWKPTWIFSMFLLQNWWCFAYEKWAESEVTQHQEFTHLWEHQLKQLHHCLTAYQAQYPLWISEMWCAGPFSAPFELWWALGAGQVPSSCTEIPVTICLSRFNRKNWLLEPSIHLEFIPC